MDGYLFFDDVTPGTRDGLFDLVEEELLSVAAVSVSGTAGGFAGYEANDVRTAYATVEAVVEVVGRPAQRLLAVNLRNELNAPRPGHRQIGEDAAVAIALLPVPLTRAEEVAHVLVRVMGPERLGVAVVLGGTGTVLVEADGADLEELEYRLAEVLSVAGVASADVMITGGALGRGWGGGAAPSGSGAHAHEQNNQAEHDQHDQQHEAEPAQQGYQQQAEPHRIQYPANG